MNSDLLAQGHWLEKRSERWKWLESRCKGIDHEASGRLDNDLEFVEGFRALGRDLALARSAMPDSPLTRYLTNLSLRCHEEIYREPGSFWQSLKTTVLQNVPNVMLDMRITIAATITLFILSILCGWWLIDTYPDLITLFASQDMVDTVESGGLWTDGLLNILPSSVLSISIITNNVMVSFTAFVLGAFYGLGTIYIISMNGLMLGSIFAFTAHFNLDHRLLEFIVAHGIVELSVICLAGAAGVSLGEALMRPGDQSRAKAFQQAVSRAGSLLVVAIPFLIGAGVIEGYISPDANISFQLKATVGVTYAALFWFVMFGGYWRTSK